jgi:hypothetical protein
VCVVCVSFSCTLPPDNVCIIFVRVAGIYCVCVCVCVCMYVLMYVCMYVCVCMYVLMYVCVCMYVCTYVCIIFLMFPSDTVCVSFYSFSG